MSVATKLRSPAKLSGGAETRAILGPGGNRVRGSEDANRTKKKGPPLNKVEIVANKTHSSSSSDYVSVGTGSVSSSDSLVKISPGSCGRRRVKLSKSKVERPLGDSPVAVRRCHWITPHSDQLYITFHDEEWGVPVHEDNKLFELLVLSQALAELSWPAILHKRDAFRKLFDDYNAESVSQYADAKLISLEAFLSKSKVEAIIENAKQILKVQREYGSFNNYCWSFANHKPILNSIKYANQVPAKSPKSLLISKDMMQRGFLCVGPTIIYSFMEAAGIVNDHLVSCFRYQECNANSNKSYVDNAIVSSLSL